MNDIIRRKVMRGMPRGAEGPSGAEGGWRLAFPRAARDAAGLLVEVTGLTSARCGLDEVLERLPDRALIALVDGPAGAQGVVALSPEVSAAMIEMQTIGRVLPATPAPRRATRTDAAMVSGIIDRALSDLDSLLDEEEDLVWAGGFTYASFIEDARPLGLLLDEQPYRLLSLQVALGGTGRSGAVLLALPAAGRGRRPVAATLPPAGGGPVFAAALAEAVLGADCRLQAVIGRQMMPLHEVMALAPGRVLVLAGAAIDRISVEGMDGRPLCAARLGQHRGMRALRLTGAATQDGAGADARAAPPAPPVASAVAPAVSAAAAGEPALRATG